MVLSLSARGFSARTATALRAFGARRGARRAPATPTATAPAKAAVANVAPADPLAGAALEAPRRLTLGAEAWLAVGATTAPAWVTTNLDKKYLA